MNKFRAAVLAALFILTTGGPLAAQDVTLTSRDGTVEVAGTLLGYDGEFYRVDTVFGELTLDGSGVTCAGPGCPDLKGYVAEIRISGARTMGDILMPALVESFARHNGMKLRRTVQSDRKFSYILSQPETGRTVARISFHNTNTDEGFADLLADESDMMMALRELRPDEIRRAREVGLGDLSAANRSRIIGLDGLVPVVAPGNTLSGISLKALALVFAGEVKNWADLGGPDAPIALHLRTMNAGMAQSFEDKAMRIFGLGFAKNVILHNSNAELVDAVAKDPFAIGISSYSEVGNTKVLSLTGACGFSIRPTVLNLKTEDYPLTAPLLLYTPARRLPKTARDFIRYLRSPSAQQVVRRAGFVDQRPVEISLKAQGARLANAIAAAGDEITLEDLKRMVAVLQSARRLSITFRFQTGSTKLDVQSRTNIEQLAQLLEAGAYQDRTLIFAGFTDGDGGADANMRIARKRANAVRDAVLKAAPALDASRLTIQVEAFGEAMPMACDDEDWGRRVNRRVEVWLK